MIPGVKHFVSFAGATFSESVEWQRGAEVVDLALYVGRMEIRKQAPDSSLMLTLATGDGIEVVEKRVRLFIDAADSRTLPPATYVYDLLFREISTGEVYALLTGEFRHKPLVTQVAP